MLSAIPREPSALKFLTWDGTPFPCAGRHLSSAAIEDGSFFYFVHSYYVVPDDTAVIAATTGYGIEFTSSIQKDNIFACQFHPEKSQGVGLRLLKNFGAWAGEGKGC